MSDRHEAPQRWGGSLEARQSQATRVLVVDDQLIVRVGIISLLKRKKRIQVIGEAGSMRDAVSQAINLRPDVVLMDVRLPDGTGIEACREIRRECQDVQVLFLSSFTDEDVLVSALLAGGAGFLPKDINEDRLLRAIETVATGESIFDTATRRAVMLKLQQRAPIAAAAPPLLTKLSRQEQRVVQLVAEGKTNKEIASDLTLSDNTVRNYIAHIFHKLKISRRAQAAAMVSRAGS
jgi:two-component system, NarL family, response regulator DevR